MTPVVWNVSAVPAGLGDASSAPDSADWASGCSPQPNIVTANTVERICDDRRMDMDSSFLTDAN